jgi:hypothetical protein
MDTRICEALKTYNDTDTCLQFTQILQDCETQVKIKLRSKDGKYSISVTNNRTDAIFNSSPITDVFKERLPELRGQIDVDYSELSSILSDLLVARPYFGISVRIVTFPYTVVMDLGYL